MSEQPKMQQQQINIELNEKEADGIYANMVNIIFNPSEFILDFVRLMPLTQKGRVHARIIMTPPNLKMLAMALQDNVKKFESQFGEIKTPGREEKNIGFQTIVNPGEK
jgi:hypothetical protein